MGRAFLLPGLEWTESGKVETWKLLPAEATENGVATRVDQHPPARRRMNRLGRKARFLRKSCLLSQKYPALACLQALVTGWNRRDE